MKKIKLEMVVVIVDRGFADKIVQISREMGITGATILNARGTGIHEQNTLLGVNIMPEKELVFILVSSEQRKKLMQALCDVVGISSEAKGLCFSLPVEEWSGICHLERKRVTVEELKQMEKKKEDDEKKEQEKESEKKEKEEIVEKKKDKKEIVDKGSEIKENKEKVEDKK